MNDNRIIISIFGGLGNQMFQYAAGFCAAKSLGWGLKYHYIPYPNAPFLLDQFSLVLTPASKKDKSEAIPVDHFFQKALLAFDRMVLKSHISRRGNTLFQHKPSFFPIDQILKRTPGGVFFLRGYWQSEKYFLDCKEAIENMFIIRERKVYENHTLYKEILENNSVCIHIRRGDYLNKKTIKHHGIIKADYYFKAVRYINENCSNPVFYCFSDDIGLAKEELKEIGIKIKYVERSENPLCDFGLMQQCKHFIIANSTFSWWAAWLSKNTQKNVIAPKAWFVKTENPDIYPPDWIIL